MFLTKQQFPSSRWSERNLLFDALQSATERAYPVIFIRNDRYLLLVQRIEYVCSLINATSIYIITIIYIYIYKNDKNVETYVKVDI